MAYSKKKEEEIEATEEVGGKKKIKSALSPSEIRNLVNKKSGKRIVQTIDEMGKIPYWIPTSSRFLNSIIRHGDYGGIPGGRIVEIAGRPGAAKSFLALDICKHAIKMGLDVFYFDSEGGIHDDFVISLGIDKEKFNHCLVSSFEETFSIIDTLLTETTNRYLFVLDSYGATATESENQGGYDPTAQISMGARVVTLGIKKLMIPLVERESTFLVLNQIRDNMMADKWEKLKNPFRVSGPWQLNHSYSLRIWLFPSDAKDNAVNIDEQKVGALVKAKIRKSRYRTADREANIIFVWSGEKPKIMDEDTWIDAIADHPNVSLGAWCTLKYKDGSEEKFRQANFTSLCNTSEKFKKTVIEYMDEILIHKWTPPEGISDESSELSKLSGGT